MSLLQAVAVAVAAAALLVLGVVATFTLRRRTLQRGGGFDMCLRLGRGWTGGWVFGVGRYRGDMLEWFRTFALTWRPTRSLPRRDLSVEGRRSPVRPESFDLPAGHVVLSCRVDGRPLEMSMTEPAATAFLAWLEAGPPGAHLVA
jgi:hypothetical protein